MYVHSLNQSSWVRSDHFLRRNASPAIVNLLQVGMEHLHRDFNVFGLLWSLFEVSNELGIGLLDLISEVIVHLIFQELWAALLCR